MLKNWKKKRYKSITHKRKTKTTTTTQSAPVKMYTNKSVSEKVNDEKLNNTKPTTAKILEETLKKFDTSENINDNRGVRDGREEKT